MPSDLTPDRKTFWRAKAEKRSEWNGVCSVSPFELLALLDASDERDRLRDENAALRRATINHADACPVVANWDAHWGYGNKLVGCSDTPPPCECYLRQIAIQAATIERLTVEVKDLRSVLAARCPVCWGTNYKGDECKCKNCGHQWNLDAAIAEARGAKL